MYSATIHRLGFQYDRQRQALVFTGMLQNGFQFEVCFPIGHVALTFDSEAANLGYIGEPMMGDVATIEGFFSSLAKIVTAPAKAVANTAKKAYDSTIKKVATQAVYYAKQGVNAVAKGAAAVGKGAYAVGKFAVNQAVVPFKAVADIASGKNVLQSLQGVIRQAQIAASFVPGVGTLAGMGLSGMNGVLQGKSLTEIAKGVVAGAIPGGPLVTGAVMTAANMVQAGVEGKNIVKAAASELAREALKFVPSSQAQAVLQSAINAGLSGQNMLQGAKAAAINQALAQIPDAGARAAMQSVLSGRSPEQALKAAGGAAGGKFLMAVAALPNSQTGAIVGGLVNQVTKAPAAAASQIARAGNAAGSATQALANAFGQAPKAGNAASQALANAFASQVRRPAPPPPRIGYVDISGVDISDVEIGYPFGLRPSHAFSAIGANGLAAIHASVGAIPRLQGMRGHVANLARSSAPHARMAIAGLQSVRV